MIRTALVFSLLTIPALASAQTLSVAVDDAPPPEPVAAPVVVTPTPAPTQPEQPADDDDQLEIWGGFGLWVDGMDLRSLDLELSTPEIAALTGVELSPGWEGNGPLAEHITGGVRIAAGMRAAGFVRGPELRLYFGGGGAEGPFAPIPGGPESLQAAVRSSFVFRFEGAVGFQAELGPIVPYVVGIASVGGAWVDVAVRDDRLGDLGTETADGALLGLGVEAGFGVRPDDGVEIGFAFRGNFLGTPSYGGLLTVSFGGSVDD